jgi:hypothetical protein
LTTTTAGVGGRLRDSRHASVLSRLRAYFAADANRTIQTVLGLIWLLDGGLQFQSFMYTRAFIHTIVATEAGQPHWLASSINAGATFAQKDLTVWNTLFALTQVALGLGLLYRPSVKLALAGTVAWSLIVWWFGEAFGMLFMGMANPLTGAPGAVFLYGLIALIAWPGRAGGLLGVRGARTAWAALWLVMAWCWLLAPNSSAHATRDAINAAPSGMSWLSTVQDWVAGAAGSHGFLIALVLAAASAAIGVAVAANWRAGWFIAAAIVLNLAYWALGQGFGGIFQGAATDPNAGLVFVLLAAALGVLIAEHDERAAAQPPGGAIRLRPVP